MKNVKTKKLLAGILCASIALFGSTAIYAKSGSDDGQATATQQNNDDKQRTESNTSQTPSQTTSGQTTTQNTTGQTTPQTTTTQTTTQTSDIKTDSTKPGRGVYSGLKRVCESEDILVDNTVTPNLYEKVEMCVFYKVETDASGATKLTVLKKPEFESDIPGSLGNFDVLVEQMAGTTDIYAYGRFTYSGPKAPTQLRSMQFIVDTTTGSRLSIKDQAKEND